MAGEGSIYKLKRDGKVIGYVAQMSRGGRASRQYQRRKRRTRAEARAALEEMAGDRRDGVTRSRKLLSVFLAEWIRDVRNIKPATRHGYGAVISYHLSPTLGDIRLCDLAPLDVERALKRLEPTLSPKSLRNAHAVLRRALGHAKRAGLVTRNVASAEYVDPPLVPDREPESFSADEVARLLAAAGPSADRPKGEWIESAIRVSLGTGLRQGELLGLAWEDVDRARGLLRVRRELVYRDGTYQRVALKNDNRSWRDVPLAPELVVAIERHEQRLKALGLVPVASGPVFPARSGQPMSGSWLTHRYYTVRERAGIRRLPWKNLRTTFASQLFAAGIPDRQIADWLGHRRERTTQRHYIDTAGGSQERALAAVGRLVG